jgi:hypothetical protein
VLRAGTVVYHSHRLPVLRWLLIGWAVSAAWPARADDVRVDAETTLQAYDVASPATPVVWARRRLTQTLGLGYVKTLGEARDDAPPASLQVHLRLRLNQEFGTSCLPNGQLCYAVVDPERRGSYTPLVDDGYIDLPYAYVETRDGPYGFSTRVGRQLHADAVGFARVDGLSARVEPATWLAFESVFGSLVRRTSVAGSDAFVPSNLPRLDLTTAELASTSYLLAPTITWLGAAGVEIGEERWLRARVSYRALQESGGWLERRVGFGLATAPSPALRFDAHAVADALQLGLIDAELGASLTRDQWHARLQLERHEPRFEASSIWAYFDVAPLWLGTLRVARQFNANFDVSLGASGRRTELTGGAEHELGADAAASLHDARDSLTLTGFGWAGGTGPLWGSSLSASRRVTLPIRIEAELSVMRIDDPMRAALSGLSLYELLGAHFSVSEESEIEIALSHAHSRAAGHRLSLLAFLHLGAWR